MLVLTRVRDQRIIIDGGRIVVTVVDVRRGPKRRDKVRLGIDAPSTVSVHREEVYESIQQNGIEREVPASHLEPSVQIADLQSQLREALAEVARLKKGVA